MNYLVLHPLLYYSGRQLGRYIIPSSKFNQSNRTTLTDNTFHKNSLLSTFYITFQPLNPPSLDSLLETLRDRFKNFNRLMMMITVWYQILHCFFVFSATAAQISMDLILHTRMIQRSEKKMHIFPVTLHGRGYTHSQPHVFTCLNSLRNYTAPAAAVVTSSQAISRMPKLMEPPTPLAQGQGGGGGGGPPPYGFTKDQHPRLTSPHSSINCGLRAFPPGYTLGMYHHNL